MADPIDLIPLADFKTAIGDSGTANDPKHERAITAASRSILTYTDRQFKPTPDPDVASERELLYDGGGVVELPDAREITSVKLDDIALAAADYIALPYNGPVYTWIELLVPQRGISPEMGFERNLDRLPANRTPQKIKVTAKWNWLEVPEDVAQAAVWTAAAFEAEPNPMIQSKAIEGYSVSYATPLISAVPDRAKQVLDPYRRERL